MLEQAASDSATPEQLRDAIEKLWSVSVKDEELALLFEPFTQLEQTCRQLYAGKAGTRLPAIKSDIDKKRHRDALKHFFRWNGAPWLEDNPPAPDKIAKNVHLAYTSSSINVTNFVPLDQLNLTDANDQPHKQVRFGPFEIGLLDRKELACRIPIAALEHFEASRRFPLDQLEDFFWLVSHNSVDAGPVWSRGPWNFLDMTFDHVGQLPLFEPTFSPILENGIFVILLVLSRRDAPWEAFRIPWEYQITDDPFSVAPKAPAPSELSWDVIGPPGDE